MYFRIRIFLLLILISQTIFSNILPVKNQDVSPSQLKSQNKEIAKLAAKALCKKLPKKIDKYTKLNKVEAIGASIVYTFEINTGAKSDQAIIKDDKKRMQKAIIYGVCKSSKRFMDAQITIIYLYKSAKTNHKLFEFKIKQSDCYRIFGAS